MSASAFYTHKHVSESLWLVFVIRFEFRLFRLKHTEPLIFLSWQLETLTVIDRTLLFTIMHGPHSFEDLWIYLGFTEAPRIYFPQPFSFMVISSFMLYLFIRYCRVDRGTSRSRAALFFPPRTSLHFTKACSIAFRSDSARVGTAILFSILGCFSKAIIFLISDGMTSWPVFMMIILFTIFLVPGHFQANGMH